MVTSSPASKQRIASIDILRGFIMLVMALDHTRDFFHLGVPDPTNLATTTPILFYTRFITHFCAPVFVFLSGISVYLTGTRRSKQDLCTFLFKRGIWLIFVELVIRTFAVTLNPMFNVFILQVIWAIGISMIILGIMVHLRIRIIAVIGAIIFFGHNILDLMPLPEHGVPGILWSIFFTGHGNELWLNSTHYIVDKYAVIPWTGVMLLGYVFGVLYRSSFNQQRRKMILMLTGSSLLVLFLVLRYFNIYGDPSPWALQKTTSLSAISFFNLTKYPCSLLYLSITLGPALIALSLIEHVQNKFTSVLITYGNVPFFYYILHFYLLRLINVALFFASGYHTNQIAGPKPFYYFHPATFGYGLPGVYLVWLVVITTLYLPCRWFSNYKKTHRQWWLSYL